MGRAEEGGRLAQAFGVLPDAGVGMAVGKAIRTSIVFVVVADFFLSFAIWGSTTTVRITG